MSMKRSAILDRRACWKAWVKPGSSIIKAKDELGIINPRTKRPPTDRAIQCAAYRYAIDGTPEDRDDARKDFVHYKLTEEAVVVGDKEWKEFMINMIRVVFNGNPEKIQKYIARHGLS